MTVLAVCLNEQGPKYSAIFLTALIVDHVFLVWSFLSFALSASQWVVSIALLPLSFILLTKFATARFCQVTGSGASSCVHLKWNMSVGAEGKILVTTSANVTATIWCALSLYQSDSASENNLFVPVYLPATEPGVLVLLSERNSQSAESVSTLLDCLVLVGGVDIPKPWHTLNMDKSISGHCLCIRAFMSMFVSSAWLQRMKEKK